MALSAAKAGRAFPVTSIAIRTNANTVDFIPTTLMKQESCQSEWNRCGSFLKRDRAAREGCLVARILLKD